VVVAQGSGRAVAVNRALYRDFETTAAGTLDATVDYTFSSSVVLLWLSKGNCTPDQAQALQCNYIATSFTGSQPRRLSATGTTPGAYTLIVGNLGPQEEAVSYQVVLTPSASTGFPLRAAGRSGVGLERIEGLPKAEAVP
jgi:hypothetical protein